MSTESDKVQLHSDATRLFRTDEDNWNSQFDDSQHSRLHHGERAGFAFASIALPAHYAAILAVLDHVKHRLDPEWRIKRVVDWGAATGSGLWYDDDIHASPSAFIFSQGFPSRLPHV